LFFKIEFLSINSGEYLASQTFSRYSPASLHLNDSCGAWFSGRGSSLRTGVMDIRTKTVFQLDCQAPLERAILFKRENVGGLKCSSGIWLYD